MNRWIVLVSGVTLVVVAVVGCIDATRSDDVSLAILFGILAVGVAGLALLEQRSSGVVLRHDLATWVDRTSAVTGETPDELTSRAVSRLRAGFSPGEDGR